MLADAQGGVTHLLERECSIQRQNQKIVEIAPSPSLPDALRERLLSDAVKLVAAADYRSAATVEVLVVGCCLLVRALPLASRPALPLRPLLCSYDACGINRPFQAMHD